VCEPDEPVRQRLPGLAVRLGPLEFRHHPRQRFGTVDQDVERSSRARLRVTGGPSHPRSIKCSQPANPLEPAPVVPTDSAANRRSEVAVGTKREIGGHGSGWSHAVGSAPPRRARKAPGGPARPSRERLPLDG
jgi:hypothetical protein